MPPKVKEFKKRLCKFSDDLQKQFPFLKKGNSTNTSSDVFCTKCNNTFSIAHGGRNDIQRHLSSEKHKKMLSAACTSSQLTDYFRQEKYGEKEEELAKAEGLWAFHTIFHNQSFNSMECTSKLIQKTFDKKFSCGKTKCEAIVKNVIAPYSQELIRKELQEVPFVSLFSDASNHNDVKLFPTLVRYFHPKTGVNIKLLDFVNLPGETSDIISNSVVQIISKHNLTEKLVGFCADNANTNFGGVSRKGVSNVFFKLQESLGRKIVGVGCSAHIAHNAVQTACDLLPVDIEHIVNKIYSYFYIFTVRVEELKTFCDDVEVQYKKMLGYSKTRWLALLPAVERILQMYKPLKSYFLSQEKCPVVITNFFSDECSELWLNFVHTNASIVQDAVKIMEGDSKSFLDVSQTIFDLKLKFSNRLDEEYIPLTIRSDLKKLEEDGHIVRNYFMGHARNFYANIVQYLDKYSYQYQDLQKFTWIQLSKPILWDDVQVTLEFYMENIKQTEYNKISEGDLFDEISFIKKYADENLRRTWTENQLNPEQRWLQVFSHFEENSIPFHNCLLLVQYIFCLPGTNAPTERIFSLMNALWTSEKTNMKVETVRAMLHVKYNMGKCEQFLETLNQNPEIVRKFHGVEKYDFKNK